MAKPKTRSTRTRSVEDRLIAGLTEFRDALRRGKAPSSRFTVRSLTLDLTPGDYDAPAVRATRQLLGVSQAVFAQFLGVSADAVQAWEQGTRTPSGPARRFMDEIRRDPRLWRTRIHEAAAKAA